MPAAHVYGHHQFNPQGGDSAWMHQQPGAHHAHTQQQQQQVAAAAAAAVQQQQQQQHFNRLAGAGQMPGHGQDADHNNVSEDNRRTMAFIADLLNENTREAALLELSKKREQVPELALILWHSFGRCPGFVPLSHWGSNWKKPANIFSRCDDLSPPGNHLSLYLAQPFAAHRRCLESCL